MYKMSKIAWYIHSTNNMCRVPMLILHCKTRFMRTNNSGMYYVVRLLVFSHVYFLLSLGNRRFSGVCLNDVM